MARLAADDNAKDLKKTQKNQKGLLRKAVLVVLYSEGHADIWRKMEGGLYMILEIEHLQQIFELPNKKGKKLG